MGPDFFGETGANFTGPAGLASLAGDSPAGLVVFWLSGLGEAGPPAEGIRLPPDFPGPPLFELALDDPDLTEASLRLRLRE